MKLYEEKKLEFLAQIKDCFLATVATHDNASVTARTMNIISHDGCFYCQTDCNSIKFKQISINNQACIAYDNVQILCNCKDIGHPFKKENSEIMRCYFRAFEKAYNKYSHLKQERLLKLVPYIIKVWAYTQDGAEISVLDMQKKEYTCKKLGY